jgi:hypothetical protein
MKFRTIGVVIRYNSTSQYGWLKSEPQTPMTPAGRNVAATASRIARKAYRLHYLRQGSDLVGIDLTKSENVTFIGTDSSDSHFHTFTVGKHTVRIFDVSDNHPGNFCSVNISDGRTEQGSSVTLKPIPGR